MRRCLIALIATLSACAGGTDPGHPAQLTSLPRELTGDEERASAAANQFAFRLFRRLSEAQSGENVFVSPLSVSFALGMTLNGAKGSTFDEMRSTLGFGADDLAKINAGYKGLMGLEAGLDPSTTFQIANSVWHKQTLSVSQPFIDAVQATFDAEVRSAPFDAGTIKQVNDWVSAKTNTRIPTILEEIRPEDVMFLINAIYFKGSWREQFDPKRTIDAPFQSIGGTQQVKMMNRPDGTGKILYHRTTTTTVGELSYGNGAFVMTIAVPDGDVNAFAASLDTATWSALIAPLQETDYQVALPKLRLEYNRELKADLKALGMNVPFEPDVADFTGMSPIGNQMYISFVQHKTFVDVNEEGTEAAAVTNVGIGVTSLPPCLCVNKPFVFAIRERFSGTILFIGKIVRIPQ